VSSKTIAHGFRSLFKIDRRRLSTS
jgi:hypothetical protein